MTRYWARSDLMAKNRKKKSENPTRGKLIVVDETGTRNSNESYVMTATVINDRIGFRDIAEVLNPNGEIGSYRGGISPFILRLSKDKVDKVYGVSIPFDCIGDGKMNKTDAIMLENLNRLIMEDYDPKTGALIIVDNKSSYDKTIKVPKILTKGMAENNRTSCVVMKSNYSGEIQTNDFITGAIGRAINNYESYPNSSVCDRLNGDTDNKLIANLGKNCKEVKLPKYPKNENMTAFVLSNRRRLGELRNRETTPDGCTTGELRNRETTPSVNTTLKRLNKKIMHRKTRKDKK